MSRSAKRARYIAEHHRLKALLEDFKRRRSKDKYKVAIISVTRIEESLEEIGRLITSMGWRL